MKVLKFVLRASHYECGERDTGYLTQLMKSNKKKTLINKLYIDEDISFDQKNIMQRNIYNFIISFMLIRKRKLILWMIFFQDLPKLNSDSCALCEGKITNGECIAAMKKWHLINPRGMIALSVEFDILFWPLIGNLVVDSVNSAFGKKELSSSQKRAVISLIHKEGIDPLFI